MLCAVCCVLCAVFCVLLLLLLLLLPWHARFPLRLAPTRALAHWQSYLGTQ